MGLANGEPQTRLEWRAEGRGRGLTSCFFAPAAESHWVTCVDQPRVLPRTPRAPFAWPCSLPLRPWYHRSFIPPACSAGSLPHAHTTVNVLLKRASLTQMKELKLYSSSMEAGVNLHDLGEGRWLCSYNNKSTVGRQNVNFCTSKGTTRKVKTPFTDCKKIFENHISEIYFKNLPLQH